MRYLLHQGVDHKFLDLRNFVLAAVEKAPYADRRVCSWKIGGFTRKGAYFVENFLLSHDFRISPAASQLTR